MSSDRPTHVFGPGGVIIIDDEVYDAGIDPAQIPMRDSEGRRLDTNQESFDFEIPARWAG